MAFVSRHQIRYFQRFLYIIKMDLSIVTLQFLMRSLFLAVVFGITFKAYKKLKLHYAIHKNLREQWKGPPCHWFWGHRGMVTKGNKYPERSITYFTEKEKEFPLGFAVYLGPLKTVLMLHHPNLVKKVLSLPASNAPKRLINYDLLKPWLGEGLLLLNGNTWFRHRRLLTSAFHFDILKPYAKIMNSCADTMLDKWSAWAESKSEFTVEVFSQCSLLTLDNVLRCLISHKSNCQTENENSFISSIKILSKLVIDRLRSKNLLMLFDIFYNLSEDGKIFRKQCKNVHKYTSNLIKKRRKKVHEETKRDSLDFLDMLLKAKDSDGNGFTDTEIQSELDTFLFEGHDTTASALAWTFYCLACNPEHQEKCFNEVNSVLGHRQNVDLSDLSSFSYLACCIKESLRMYPPVPEIARTLSEDVHAEGKTILKGTVVCLSLIGVQRSELFWKNPQKFDPSRFTLESAAAQNNHAYIPFAAGARNCIGQHFAMNEVKITIAKAIRKFKFAIDPDQRITPCIELVYRARGGLKLIVTPRA